MWTLLLLAATVRSFFLFLTWQATKRVRLTNIEVSWIIFITVKCTSLKIPDNTLSMIMNEIQEVRRDQEFLSSAYEETKNELQTVKSDPNTTSKEIVATLKKQN